MGPAKRVGWKQSARFCLSPFAGRPCLQKSVVFIHIPAPRFLQYNISNEPQKLQIIDQPLDTATLVGVLSSKGYYLDKMETYSVFFEEKDYQYFVFKRNTKVTKSTLRGKWPVFIERTILKIKNSIFL